MLCGEIANPSAQPSGALGAESNLTFLVCVSVFTLWTQEKQDHKTLSEAYHPGLGVQLSAEGQENKVMRGLILETLSLDCTEEPQHQYTSAWALPLWFCPLCFMVMDSQH